MAKPDPGPLPNATIQKYRHRLNERREQLQAEIESGSAEQAAERSTDLAGEVHDEADQSVGSERSEVRNAMIGRDIGEVRSIEAALNRIDAGQYGYCIACGDEIDAARLDVQPSAIRCAACQTRHERSLSTHAPTTL